MSAYNVRIWDVPEHKGKDRKTGKPHSTYRVRWVVAGRQSGNGLGPRASTGAASPRR
jgi:hypothetical protein